MRTDTKHPVEAKNERDDRSHRDEAGTSADQTERSPEHEEQSGVPVGVLAGAHLRDLAGRVATYPTRRRADAERRTEGRTETATIRGLCLLQPSSRVPAGRDPVGGSPRSSRSRLSPASSIAVTGAHHGAPRAICGHFPAEQAALKLRYLVAT